jgi:hypothetical protein
MGVPRSKTLTRLGEITLAVVLVVIGVIGIHHRFLAHSGEIAVRDGAPTPSASSTQSAPPADEKTSPPTAPRSLYCRRATTAFVQFAGGGATPAAPGLLAAAPRSAKVFWRVALAYHPMIERAARESGIPVARIQHYLASDANAAATAKGRGVAIRAALMRAWREVVGPILTKQIAAAPAGRITYATAMATFVTAVGNLEKITKDTCGFELETRLRR